MRLILLVVVVCLAGCALPQQAVKLPIAHISAARDINAAADRVDAEGKNVTASKNVLVAEATKLPPPSDRIVAGQADMLGEIAARLTALAQEIKVLGERTSILEKGCDDLQKIVEKKDAEIKELKDAGENQRKAVLRATMIVGIGIFSVGVGLLVWLASTMWKLGAFLSTVGAAGTAISSTMLSKMGVLVHFIVAGAMLFMTAVAVYMIVTKIRSALAGTAKGTERIITGLVAPEKVGLAKSMLMVEQGKDMPVVQAVRNKPVKKEYTL